jgi:hypothetical protein
LTPQQQRAFRQVLEQFIADLRRGTFRPALRVKRVQGYPGVWEVSWAPDGRATFEYGDEIQGEPHIVCGGSGRTTCFAGRKPYGLKYPPGTRNSGTSSRPSGDGS